MVLFTLLLFFLTFIIILPVEALVWSRTDTRLRAKEEFHVSLMLSSVLREPAIDERRVQTITRVTVGEELKVFRKLFRLHHGTHAAVFFSLKP